MIPEILIVYCVGVVGDVQVVEIEGKTTFLKGQRVECEWKSNNANKSEILQTDRTQEEPSQGLFTSFQSFLDGKNVTDTMRGITVMIDPYDQNDYLCPIGQHGFIWKVDEEVKKLVDNPEDVKFESWGFCTKFCAYKKLRDGTPTNCNIDNKKDNQ